MSMLTSARAGRPSEPAELAVPYILPSLSLALSLSLSHLLSLPLSFEGGVGSPRSFSARELRLAVDLQPLVMCFALVTPELVGSCAVEDGLLRIQVHVSGL